MQTDEFEWDDHKAARNFEKHGVRFEGATFAFDDPDGVNDLDETAKYGEHRFRWIQQFSLWPDCWRKAGDTRERRT